VFVLKKFYNKICKSRLHIEEFRDLYSSLNIILVIESKIMGRAGHVARMRQSRDANRDLLGKPE